MDNLSDYTLLTIGFISGSIVMTIVLSLTKSGKENCPKCELRKEKEITPVRKRTKKIK